MIKELVIECPNKCGNNTTIGNLKDHKRLCEKRKYACNYCEF